MSLHVRDVSFRYPDQTRPVVDRVNLSFSPGEFVLLLGSNGSGKSTLVRLMGGLFLPDSGAVVIDGIDTVDVRQRPRLRRKMGLVFQHPENQIVAQTVGDEVAFGLENLNLPAAEIESSVFQTLERMGLRTFADCTPDSLSGGQLQRLALAGVLALRPDYLLMDEPFAWLDLAAQTALLGELQSVRQAGCAVLLVSQETDLLEHVDRVWLMHEGRLVADTTPQALAETPERFERAGLQAPPLMTLCHRLSRHLPREPVFNAAQAARWLAPYLKQESSPIEPPAAILPAQTTLLRAEQVGFDYDARLSPADWLFQNVDLTLPAADWLVLSGPSGCGKSSLIQLFNGLLRPLSGVIELQGRSVAQQKTVQLCRQVGLVFQNPRQQFFAATVFDELSYALQEQSPPLENILDRVQAVCQRLALDTNVLQRAPQRLSGGEQLKVALGSLFLLEPDLLILDETLTSLDPVARTHTLSLLQRLNQEGLTILTVTHRPAQMLPFAKRIVWMESGRLEWFGAATAPSRWLPEIAQLSTALWGQRLFEVDAVYRGILQRLKTCHP